MSDSGSEKDNEGEEEEEGGEEEKDEPEPVEEIKAPEPPPRYYPKISPLTHVQNINRDLDMLNSEVNLLSSQFMLTVASGKAPTFTTAAPMSNQPTGMYSIPPQTYSSPVRDHTKAPGYFSNPNHINLSPGYNQSYYNIPQKPMYSSQYQFQNQAPSTSLYNPYGGSSNYSPVRNQFGNYNYQGSNMYNPMMGGMNDTNYGQLLSNIDKVLSPSQPQMVPQSNPFYNQPQFQQTMPSYNTFERGSTYTPNFSSGVEYPASQHHFPSAVAASRPPLYVRPRSVSQRRSPVRNEMPYGASFNENSRKPLKQ